MTKGCTTTGCGRTAKARGLCAYHYNRGRKEGWLQKLGPRDLSECSVEGCARVEESRGMCSLHYGRTHRATARAVDAPPPERGKFWECSEEGCIKRHAGDGLCQSHGSTFDSETAESRLCDWCGHTLPRSSFYQPPNSRYLERSCTECRKTKGRLGHIRRTYGDAAGQMQQRLDDEEPCGICGVFKDGAMCVDHCHESGVVRGILCRTCNAAIGQLGDSVEMLESAIRYLEENCVS